MMVSPILHLGRLQDPRKELSSDCRDAYSEEIGEYSFVRFASFPMSSDKFSDHLQEHLTTLLPIRRCLRRGIFFEKMISSSSSSSPKTPATPRFVI